MRGAMVKLSGVVARRRWIVIGLWAALLIAAVPLAMRQTDNLTGGGFDVPGSASLAIALDATLVRLILVPAAMQLMGRWNWWLPGWLDRILPDLNVEGDSQGDSIEPPDRSAKQPA